MCCNVHSNRRNFPRWTCAVNVMYKLMLILSSKYTTPYLQSCSISKYWNPLLIATAFKGCTLIAIALCAFHPCLHLSHFPVCSIHSAVDNVLVSFLQSDLKDLWERRELIFFPKSKGLYTYVKETWNKELRYIFVDAKSLCMLTVLTHDIYLDCLWKWLLK